MNEESKNILGMVFGDKVGRPKKEPVIRGRTGIRRPERSTKAGYLGRGYKGPEGRMQGQWQSGETEVPDLPKAPSKPESERERVYEFEDMEDMILSMVIIGFMHANPGITAKEATDAGNDWMRKYGMPGKKHLWRKQMARIERRGIRAEASKIRREMFRLI